jgi:probable HAF family extracellular repeat protein
MTAPTSITRGRAAVAAAAVLTALTALCAMPASAAFPPAAAGKTIHGYVAKDGALTPIDHPKAPSVPLSPDASAGTSATAINDRGEILGACGDTSRLGKDLLFVRDRTGRFTRIPDPFPRDSLTELIDINNRREIVGVSYATQADLDRGVSHGFRLDRRGRLTRIDVPGAALTAPFRSNDRGQVTGFYADADWGFHGFVWEDGEFTTVDVPGASATFLFGINNRGQTVGLYVDADGNYHGLLRGRGGAVRTLDAPGAALKLGGTTASSINDKGQVVGVVADERGGTRGFLYQRGVFTAIDGPNAAFTRGLDINNRGQFVGDYGTTPPARGRADGKETR